MANFIVFSSIIGLGGRTLMTQHFQTTSNTQCPVSFETEIAPLGIKALPMVLTLPIAARPSPNHLRRPHAD